VKDGWDCRRENGGKRAAGWVSNFHPPLRSITKNIFIWDLIQHCFAPDCYVPMKTHEMMLKFLIKCSTPKFIIFHFFPLNWCHLCFSFGSQSKYLVCFRHYCYMPWTMLVLSHFTWFLVSHIVFVERLCGGLLAGHFALLSLSKLHELK
jgi:hypothetical protein